MDHNDPQDDVENISESDGLDDMEYSPNPQEQDEVRPEQGVGSYPHEADSTIMPARRHGEVITATKFLATGLLIGIVVGGIAIFRNNSLQAAIANKLITTDTCLGSFTSPTGFCFNSPVKVSLASSNPLSQLYGSQNNAVVSSAKSRIGIFADAALELDLNGLEGAPLAGSGPLDKTSAASVSGTLSLAYSDLTHTLQSGSNPGSSIFYAGNNEIGTSNQVTYQGQSISLVVISKIELKNNQLYLTPETVNALGRSAPASSVFSSTAPVPINIASVPEGLSYLSVSTTKQYIVFRLAGKNISLGTLFTPR